MFKLQESFNMGKLFSFIIFGPLFLNLFLWVENKDVVTFSPSLNSSFSVYKNLEEKKCSECHADVIAKKVQHPAALDDGCTSCHQSNNAEHPKAGTKTFSLAEKMPDLCFTCHDGIKSDLSNLKVVHGAVKEKKLCINCHSPHSSDQSKLLIATDKQLCLSCHNRTITSGTKKFANIQQLLKNSKTIHPPVDEGCISCHKPHASSTNYLLAKSFPEGSYSPAKKDSFALCFDCHDAGLLETATSNTVTNFRNGEKNLHYVHINGEKGRSCAVCHNIHGSTNEHLIQDKIPFGNWEMQMKYSSDATGGSCSPGCHGEKKYVR